MWREWVLTSFEQARNEVIQYNASTLQTYVKCHMGHYNVTCMRQCHLTVM